MARFHIHSVIHVDTQIATAPQSAQLEAGNKALEGEVADRIAAEGLVRRMNLELERRVAERTRDLERIKRELETENRLRREAKDRLVQAQKLEAVGLLASGIAHDFNNLVTIMVGYTALLKRRMNPDDPSVRLVDEVQRAAGSLVGQRGSR
ncbi:MAG: hypothetical protein ABI995_04810 [Acidobacteriota bacterium]